MKILAIIILSLMSLVSCSDTTAPSLEPLERLYARTVVVKVGTFKFAPPFSYNLNGAPAGMAIDYLNLVTQKTGLKFEFIEFSGADDALKAIRAGTVDLLAAATADGDHTSYMDFAPKYFSEPIVMLVDELPIKFPMKVGYSYKHPIQGTLERLGQQVIVVPFATAEDGFNNLLEKKISGLVLGRGAANFLEIRHNRKYYRSPVDFQYDVSFGFTKGNFVLGNILEEALSSISVKDHEIIKQRARAFALEQAAIKQ